MSDHPNTVKNYDMKTANKFFEKTLGILERHHQFKLPFIIKLRSDDIWGSLPPFS
jgi:hypothetical protein